MSEILYVLLPNGRQQFLDANGAPLASGSVGMYTPGTTDPKATWLDPYGNAANENPIPLDAAGSALIYGVGQYRQIVKNSAGVVIWDALTYGAQPAGALPVPGGFGTQTQIASNATIDLGSIATHNALIVGNTTIGSFGASAELGAPMYYIEFDSACTVLYDPVGLIIPGKGDLNALPGDAALCEYLGAGNWKIIAVWPAKGEGFWRLSQLAAAATTDLGTAGSANVLIGGAAAISSFGASAALSQPVYLLRFAAAGGSLVHSAALVLPGGLDIEIAAGDSALAEYGGAGNWIILAYWRQDGQAVRPTPQLARAWFLDSGAYAIALPDTITSATRVKITAVGGGGAGGASDNGNTNGGSGGGGAAWQSIVLYGFAPGGVLSGTTGLGGGGVVDAAGGAGTASTVVYNGHTVVSAGGGAGGGRSGNPPGGGGVIANDLTGLGLETAISITGSSGVKGGYAGSNINWSGSGGGSATGSGGGTLLAASGGGTLINGQSAAGWGGGGGGSVGGTGLSGGPGTPGFVQIELLSYD